MRKVEVRVTLPDGTPLAAWTTDEDGNHEPLATPPESAVTIATPAPIEADGGEGE